MPSTASDTRIQHIQGRQILDSRGRPTVEVDVTLADGSMGRAAVPSGASTGASEAHELRDGDPDAYGGKGVLTAVAHVNGELRQALHGADACDQREADARMRTLDGTPLLGRLGANAILGVSLALCRATALATRQPLHRYIAQLAGHAAPTLPVPMVNIFSGGMHARHGMDVQDFLVMPVRAGSMPEAILQISRVRDAASAVCQRRGLPTLLADEGGLSPGCASTRAALDLLLETIEAAGLRPGEDIVIAMDVAATTLQVPGGYGLQRESRVLDSDAMIDELLGWVRDYPIRSIEDALGEEDWAGWARLSARMAQGVQLIGDDLFTTHTERLARGIRERVANGVLVKFNQNGTLSGTLDVIAQARAAGYAPVISARSGETEDAFMADLAVGTGAGQIKIGSLRTSSTVCKYNQLLRIAEAGELPYAGIGVLAGASGGNAA